MKARLTDVFVKATIEPNDRLCRGLLTITFQKLAAQPAPRLASKCSRLLKMTCVKGYTRLDMVATEFRPRYLPGLPLTSSQE